MPAVGVNRYPMHKASFFFFSPIKRATTVARHVTSCSQFLKALKNGKMLVPFKLRSLQVKRAGVSSEG